MIRRLQMRPHRLGNKARRPRREMGAPEQCRQHLVEFLPCPQDSILAEVVELPTLANMPLGLQQLVLDLFRTVFRLQTVRKAVRTPRAIPHTPTVPTTTVKMLACSKLAPPPRSVFLRERHANEKTSDKALKTTNSAAVVLEVIKHSRATPPQLHHLLLVCPFSPFSPPSAPSILFSSPIPFLFLFLWKYIANPLTQPTDLARAAAGPAMQMLMPSLGMGTGVTG